MADLRDAIEAVTVLQVAAHLGIPGLKIGMNKSPFREVRSGEPFSIPARHNGHVFKDHGFEEHCGNCWKFLELARPNLPKGERAGIIFRLAGMDSGSVGFDKNEYRRKKMEARKTTYKRRDAEFLKVKEFERPKDWSAAVAGRWADGAGLVPISRLAKSRGWPEGWVEWLIEGNKVSFPMLPWGDPKFPKARHGLSFKVEYPIFSQSCDLQLRPGGYHQQWRRVVEGVPKKDWLFIPNVPRKCSTDFQRALMEEGNHITPFPFLLGDFHYDGFAASIRNIIITEGQWDAVSVYGAAGWFSDSAEPRTLVFGMRGSQSIEVFMAFYAQWIRRIKPNILLLPDNDSAGRKWVDPIEDNRIIPTPTFAQRLKAWGAKRVEHRAVAREYGKDFNDYWKARRPNEAAVLEWLAECGLEF